MGSRPLGGPAVTGTGRNVGASTGAGDAETWILSEEFEEVEFVLHAVGTETAIPRMRIENRIRMRLTNFSF